MKKDKDMHSAQKAKLLLAAALVVGVSVALGWSLLTDPAPSPGSGEISTPAPPDSRVADSRPSETSTLAIALRQGRCQALDHHLTGMAEASNDMEVEAKRKAMGLLVGEMMNGYRRDAAIHPSSNAVPAVHTAEGQRGLNEARDSFRETLRSVKGMNGADAAAKIAESCMACHSRFVRGGGKGLLLISVDSSRN